MKAIRLSLYVVFLILLISCEDNNNPANNSNNNTNTANTYFPMTKGSWWKYYSTANKKIEIYKQTLVRDTIINGKKYLIAINDMNNDLSFARVENNNIYQVMPPQISSTFREEIVMKDNPVEGDKWSYDVVISGVNFIYQYETISTGGTRVVSEKTYQNVVKVLHTIIMDYMGNKFEYSRVNYYYAKGVGLIELER